MPSPPRRAAGWLAGREPLPTSLRALLGYYASTGVLDLEALWLRGRVEETVDAQVASVNERVASAIERQSGAAGVTFGYATKLTMPVELTLGYLYRRLSRRAPAGRTPVTGGRYPPWLRLLGDPDGDGTGSRAGAEARRRADAEALRGEVERAEDLSALLVEALFDGDMRDAIADDEYGDFEVSAREGRVETERAARIAQSTLEARIEDRLNAAPEGVRAAYESAVAVAERHQDQDEHFRSLLADGDLAAIRESYRDAPVEDAPDTLAKDTLELPYFRTQYERVGVIYHGMVQMCRAAGFEVDPAFERSLVLAIVGAQIWLDDVEDYPADVREGQLTPVTAEYALAETDAEARRRVIELTEAYLERARAAATEADSPLTGIAVEYIRRSGDPSVLPG